MKNNKIKQNKKQNKNKIKERCLKKKKEQLSVKLTFFFTL